MKVEYDLAKLRSRKNPHARKLKQQVTLRLDPDVVAYFKDQATQLDMPYQTLINLYLRDCRSNGRELKMSWSG